MGLDFIEIVIRIEEEFSIDLTDCEFASIRTVGDLYEDVLSKLGAASKSSCLSSKTFYLTRRAMVDSLGLPSRSIHPNTTLETLLPVESRRCDWAQIAAHIGLEFPKLQPTKAQKDASLMLSLLLPTAVVLAAWAMAHIFLGWAVDVFFFWLPAFFVWIFLTGLTNSLLAAMMRGRVLELPAETVGDLARIVLTMNFETLSPPSAAPQPLNREEVWARIVHIFSDQMGIDEEEIVPRARIASDLRID